MVTRYLNMLVADALFKKRRIGRINYYVNIALNRILTGGTMTDGTPTKAT